MWIGEVPLCDRFSRLYVLAENPSCSVAEMHHLGWDEGGEVWKWRRRLFAWEKDLLRNCCFTLYNIVLQDGVHDRWKWSLKPINGFSVSNVYHMFTVPVQNTARGLTQLMFGSNTSHIKYLYLHGSSSATVFQQRIISSRWVSFKHKQMPA